MPRDMTTTITRAKGGSEEHKVNVHKITIPDLWHVAKFLDESNRPRAAAAVLEVWHLCHDLKNHITG